MTKGPIAGTGLHLVVGCSLVLLIAVGGRTAVAHSGSQDHGSSRHESGDHVEHHHHYRHHHHDHHHGPPVHGPGSSHNPIVYHPPVKPVPKPIGVVGTAQPVSAPVVRDHRRPPPRDPRPNPRCNQRNISGCPSVRDHRTPPPTQCLGNLC